MANRSGHGIGPDPNHQNPPQTPPEGAAGNPRGPWTEPPPVTIPPRGYPPLGQRQQHGYQQPPPPPGPPPSTRDPQQRRPKLPMINILVVLVCTVVSAGSAAWSSWEARRNNDFSQRNASSAAVTRTDPIMDEDGCIPVPDEKTPLTLNGTAKLADGATLWEITQGVKDSSLYPGPRAVMSAGSSSWSITIPNIGGPTDRGGRYTLLLVSATPNAAHDLNPAASAVGSEYKPLQRLPDGTEIVEHVCVRRAA